MNANIGDQQVVVVLGMHRSGTSLVGNIIQSLGVFLGDDLIIPDRNNQAGYFEHAEIVRLHVELLEIIDRRWTGPKGTLDYPDHWWRSPEVELITSQLKEIIRSEMAKAKGIWGYKDPRVSRLIPLWNCILEELDIEPIYVLSLRDPSAVAASVLRRDAIDSSRAQLLWLVHNLDALRDSGDRLKCVVDYDTWFTNPVQQLKRLVKSIGIADVDDSALNNTTGLIRPELRHHRPIDFAYLPFVQDLFVLLEDSARTGEISKTVWEIAEEVQRSKDLFQSWSDFIESSETPIRRKPSHRSDRGGVKVKLIASLRSRVKQSLTD